jgi:hypothetical protein
MLWQMIENPVAAYMVLAVLILGVFGGMVAFYQYSASKAVPTVVVPLNEELVDEQDLDQPIDQKSAVIIDVNQVCEDGPLHLPAENRTHPVHSIPLPSEEQVAVVILPDEPVIKAVQVDRADHVKAEEKKCQESLPPDQNTATSEDHDQSDESDDSDQESCSFFELSANSEGLESLAISERHYLSGSEPSDVGNGSHV